MLKLSLLPLKEDTDITTMNSAVQKLRGLLNDNGINAQFAETEESKTDFTLKASSAKAVMQGADAVLVGSVQFVIIYTDNSYDDWFELVDDVLPKIHQGSRLAFKPSSWNAIKKVGDMNNLPHFCQFWYILSRSLEDASQITHIDIQHLDFQAGSLVDVLLLLKIFFPSLQTLDLTGNDACNLPDSSEIGYSIITGRTQDANKVPESIPQKMPESIPEQIPESIPEQVPESIPEQISESIPESIPHVIEQSTEIPTHDAISMNSESKVQNPSVAQKPIEAQSEQKPKEKEKIIKVIPEPTRNPDQIPERHIALFHASVGASKVDAIWYLQRYDFSNAINAYVDDGKFDYPYK